jgi:HSF-type DNA-binding
MQRSNRKAGKSGHKAPDTHGETDKPQAASDQSADPTGASEPTTMTWDTPPLNFPARLMQILQLEDPPEGIHWLPDGERFVIHIDKIEDVLVTFFQGAKWLSFTRTLNKW